MTMTAQSVSLSMHNTPIAVCNPYDGKQAGEIRYTPLEDIPGFVQHSSQAALAFRHSMPHERRMLLNNLATQIENDAANLASLICEEMGKTIREASNEVRRAQNTLRLAGDAATFLDGETMHCGIVTGGVDRQAVVTYTPVGVVAAITPFNYPLNLLCHKLGPAIAAGNAIIAKPSPKAPLTATRLCQLAHKAGFPKDLFQIIHGGADQAVVLAQSPINLLSFTGGPEAGLALKRASNLVRCLMELGGNDPLFVMPDADIPAAVKTAVAQRFEIAGQSCAAVKKLYLHQDIKQVFIDQLLPAIAALKVGDPRAADTDMGPVIDEAAAQEVCRRIGHAAQNGAQILAGGNREGALIEPTVIKDVDPASELMAKETFGPVISIRSFSNLDTAVQEINNTNFGLQAGIYTNNHSVIRQFSRQIQVGGVMINEGPDFRAEHVPFGGIKGSGLGREGVRITLREMSEAKVVID